MRASPTHYNHRKSGTQVNGINKITLVKKLIYATQYKEQFKKASALLKHNVEKIILEIVFHNNHHQFYLSEKLLI